MREQIGMPARRGGVTGTWTGRFVDVQGREGELTLELRTRGGAVRGAFRTEIAGQHEPIRDEGRVEGKTDGESLVLELVGRKNASVALDAHTLELTEGGRGLCGTYRVSARTFSPLGGGVVALSADRSEGSVEVKMEVRG
jgi:hypothetical protein